MVKLQEAAQNVLSDHDEFDFEIGGTHTDVLAEAYMDDDLFVGHFRLSTMPANPYYVVSWAVKIHEDFRGLGLGQEFLELRLQIVAEAGAHTYLNTVRWDNGPQRHIMEKYGFEPLCDENDDRTTSIWMRQVEDEPEPVVAQ